MKTSLFSLLCFKRKDVRTVCAIIFDGHLCKKVIKKLIVLVFVWFQGRCMNFSRVQQQDRAASLC